MELTFVLVVVLGTTATILRLSQVAKRHPFSVSQLEFINFQSKYQFFLVGVALLLLPLLAAHDSTNFGAFFAVGSVGAPAQDVQWLAIQNESWLSLGTSLSLSITLATTIFVYLRFRNSAAGIKHLFPYLHWVILFAATNAFAEEVIYRLGVVVPLFGHMGSDYILLISAVAFGVPHLRGMPNGLIGATMAGILGWLLAKSVVETNGIFWAWSIHFLQDIVIFSAFVLEGVAKIAVEKATGKLAGAACERS
ncbi:MAG: CPBP family intramembrane metalloprotease [Rhodocyclaceae bacterium]|nr:CPBP family intramembrane metalloprotease [Rhodocyclaceae bacterium]